MNVEFYWLRNDPKFIIYMNEKSTNLYHFFQLIHVNINGNLHRIVEVNGGKTMHWTWFCWVLPWSHNFFKFQLIARLRFHSLVSSFRSNPISEANWNIHCIASQWVSVVSKLLLPLTKGALWCNGWHWNIQDISS